MAYIASALSRELRRFDRVGMPSDRELLVILPGADGPRGEMVARRVLDRLRAIKVEARGRREPLRISVGLAAWRANATPSTMLTAREGGRRALGQRRQRGRRKPSGHVCRRSRPRPPHNSWRCSPDQSSGCCG